MVGVSRCVVRMTIDDAEHFTPEKRAEIIASYLPHERDARTRGIPQLGSGRVFPLGDDQVSCEPFQPPDWWPQIGGLDYGYDHPFAAVRVAHDTDNDIAYVIQTYRQRLATPVVHAAALRVWGEGLPFAWPHDGMASDKSSGEPLRNSYMKEKLRLLPEHAPVGLEFGIMEMLDRMLTGRLKVFSHLGDWFEEFRLYHRKDGVIQKRDDDLMSATRYAVTSLKFARTTASKKRVGPEHTEMDFNAFAW